MDEQTCSVALRLLTVSWRNNVSDSTLAAGNERAHVDRVHMYTEGGAWVSKLQLMLVLCLANRGS